MARQLQNGSTGFQSRVGVAWIASALANHCVAHTCPFARQPLINCWALTDKSPITCFLESVQACAY
jgi:hypothetical protein